jgi:hypothetical protein
MSGAIYSSIQTIHVDVESFFPFNNSLFVFKYGLEIVKIMSGISDFYFVRPADTHPE